ncbi:MAG: RnfABCDGE type electron transport complex subunit D [Planctomycetes bacterium]|nr:RnfABCDGE type electron transport complex subunit D [Planctomycetota bacterium]
MTEAPRPLPPATLDVLPPWRQPPLLRAPEGSRTVFLVSLVAAAAPLAAGVVLFGYRAAAVALLSVAGCVGFEWAYFRVTRTPALGARSHAWLTGLLLALTLPASVPWYVPLVGAAFAIVAGKAIFGGVGHFLWQPALVGRLAVGVLFAASVNPAAYGLLEPSRVVLGDVRDTRAAGAFHRYGRHAAGAHAADAVALPRPIVALRDLSRPGGTPHRTLADGLLKLPSMAAVLAGATAGAIGETASLVLVLAGLYLVYRHYVAWFLPAAVVLAAAAVAAIAPIQLLGPEGGAQRVWLPLRAEGLDVGFTYISYHVGTGGLLLAAFFLASEMTTRPVTPLGQILFGLGCGVAGMLLRLYTPVPTPFYLAVLAMNTFTPLLERFTRPRVLGTPPWWVRAWRRHVNGESRIPK